MIRSRTSFIAACTCLALTAFAAATAQATQTSFTYTQADSTTGAGLIAPFSFDDGGGPILFGATPMPAAIVINPNPGLTPAGYVGAQNAQSGAANEANTSVGLTFPSSVVATGVRGTNIYEMVIPLTFVPEVNQTPLDLSDYTWNVTYGDAPTSDTVSSAALRFAMWLSRDDVIDAADTANTFQRYTQQNLSFVAGPDAFVNTDISSTAIKDATDAGDPAGTDAAGRPLAFYFGSARHGRADQWSGSYQRLYHRRPLEHQRCIAEVDSRARHNRAGVLSRTWSRVCRTAPLQEVSSTLKSNDPNSRLANQPAVFVSSVM